MLFVSIIQMSCTPGLGIFEGTAEAAAAPKTDNWVGIQVRTLVNAWGHIQRVEADTGVDVVVTGEGQDEDEDEGEGEVEALAAAYEASL